MKTLPGIKTALFFTLVFVVGLGVYAGQKNKKAVSKQKVIVQFGWDEAPPFTLNPAPHSIGEIKAYLTGANKPKHYKIQHYVDSNPDGAPEGDLNICLPTPTPPPANAVPQPSGTPSGAKTQSVRGSPSSTLRTMRIVSLLG